MYPARIQSRLLVPVAEDVLLGAQRPAGERLGLRQPPQPGQGHGQVVEEHEGERVVVAPALDAPKIPTRARRMFRGRR